MCMSERGDTAEKIQAAGGVDEFVAESVVEYTSIEQQKKNPLVADLVARIVAGIQDLDIAKKFGAEKMAQYALGSVLYNTPKTYALFEKLEQNREMVLELAQIKKEAVEEGESDIGFTELGEQIVQKAIEGMKYLDEHKEARGPAGDKKAIFGMEIDIESEEDSET